MAVNTGVLRSRAALEMRTRRNALAAYSGPSVVRIKPRQGPNCLSGRNVLHMATPSATEITLGNRTGLSLVWTRRQTLGSMAWPHRGPARLSSPWVVSTWKRHAYFACASMRDRMPETPLTHKQKSYDTVIIMCKLPLSCANLVRKRNRSRNCLLQGNLPQRLIS